MFSPVLPGDFVQIPPSGGGGGSPPFNLNASDVLAQFTSETNRNFALDSNGRPVLLVGSGGLQWDNNDNPKLQPKTGSAYLGIDGNSSPILVNANGNSVFQIDGNGRPFLQSDSNQNKLFYFDNNGNPTITIMGANGNSSFGFDGNNYAFLQGSNGTTYGFDSAGNMMLSSPGGGNILMTLPTIDPHNAGQWWNNLSIVTISNG